MRIVLSLCLFFLAVSVMAADLVQDGKTCADIVIADNADPGIRMAAKDLQKYLRLISGAELKIEYPSTSKSKVKVCVGESICTRKSGYEMPVFRTSGYDIWVKGDLIVLNGPSSFHTEKFHPFEKELHEQNRAHILSSMRIQDKQLQVSPADDCGPMHAVSAFLESLGIRFYAPYADGTVIPHKKTISVPDCRITREAAFARREYQNSTYPEMDTEGMLWLKRLKTGSATPRIGTFPLALVMRNEGAKHPEWTAFGKDGKKLWTHEQCPIPRYLSKSFQKACVKYLQKMFDENRSLEYVMIAEPVSCSQTDYRDFESFRNPGHYPDPVRNNIHFFFYLEIAKELEKTHPDRKLVWVNLKNLRIPDTRFISQKQKNMILFPGSVSVHRYSEERNCEAMKNLYKTVIGQDKAEQHEFWNDPVELQAFPLGFWSLYSLQQIRQIQSAYLSGFLMDIPTDREKRLATVPLTHLAIYVNSKLLWNPNLDLKALLDEYYTLWYGPAAEKMRDFQAYAEYIAARKGSVIGRSKIEPAEITVWFDLLENAKSCTMPGSIYRKRIELLEKSFEWMKTAFQNKTPKGEIIQAAIFPYDVKCDGDLTKYGKWISLPSRQNDPKTEFSVAFDEARKMLQIGFRCYEKDMRKVPSKCLPPDSDDIFSRDHIKISFYSSSKGIYSIAVDPAGSLFDGSNYCEALDNNGSFAGWNPPLTKCNVRRHADRWDGEVFIDITQCGGTPDWAPAWGLNIARIQYADGKKKTVTLVPGAGTCPASGTSSWKQLILPKTDAKGHLCNVFKNIIVPLPGVRQESVYTICKAKRSVNLSDPWDGASWKDIPELRLGYEMFKPGLSSGFCPDAKAKIQYDNKYIYVLYKVDDRYVCANCIEDQSMVCLDSTMEIFLRPNGTGSYYNFEANCIGTLLLYQCTPNQGAVPLSLEELKTIKRFSTLKQNFKGEIIGPITWRMGLQIPVDLFVRHSQVKLPLTRQVWTGNVMKCADKSSHPCWLYWYPSATFHCPDEFGTFIFE